MRQHRRPASFLHYCLQVLGLYKGLVQAVHAENQRHAAELNAIVMRQL